MSKPAPRKAIVQSIKDITPNMRRIVLGGPDMADFPEGMEGGYIKLIFPNHPRTNPDKPVMRTYSIRSHNVEAGQIAVDFAMHPETGGIAIDWAMHAKVGDTIPIAGPGTVKMAPADADWYLITADMTGLPAGLRNLEILPKDARGVAVFEISSIEDKQEVNAPDGVEIRWVVDPAPQKLQGTLLKAVQSVSWAKGRPFVWTACEFDTMRALRTYYRTEKSVDREVLYLSSYWRAGRSEDQHKIDKRKDAESS